MKKIILFIFCLCSIFSYSQYGSHRQGKIMVLDSPPFVYDPYPIKNKQHKVSPVIPVKPLNPVILSKGDKLLLELMNYIKYNKLNNLKCYFYNSDWSHKFKFYYKGSKCEIHLRDKTSYIKYRNITYQKTLNYNIVYKAEISFVVDYFKFDKTAKWIIIN